MTDQHDLRYPIGKPVFPETIGTEDRRYAIQTLAEMPEQLREAVRGLSEEQLDTPYREGGWTVRQLVHHIADSHMTAYLRMKKGITDDGSEIYAYDEAAFAALPDSVAPVEWSLDILEGVHARWVMLLQGLDGDMWKHSFRHPERGPQTLETSLLLYGWHARHHVAHITGMRQRGDY